MLPADQLTTVARTLPKYTEPLRDTPQSIGVITDEVMQQQGTTTLRDALRNVAGISLAAGEGGAQGDSLTIRGFTARNDIFIDGMRDFGSYYRDPFALDAVEVLRGPSSVTFGRGSTGDINQPLGDDAAMRINVLGHDSHVAERDVAENRRYGILGSVATGIGTATRFDLQILHQTANDIPDYGMPWLFDRPADVRRENYYGFAGGNYLNTDVNIGTTKVTHTINDTLSLRSQLRYAHYSREVRVTEPKLGTDVTASTPLDAVNSVETFLQNQTDLTGVFDTGRVHHSVTGGIEIGRETSDPTRFTYTGVPSTSLLSPDPEQPFAGTAAVSAAVHATSKSAGIYALDTMTLSPQWELSSGLRFDRFDTDYVNTLPTLVAFSRVDQMPTGRAALVYKPRPSGSIYADVSTSFNPSAETLALSALTADAPPEKNRNYELGTKWDLQENRYSLRAALFRTDKLNAREPDPNNPLEDVLAGQQRVDGTHHRPLAHALRLRAHGQPSRRLAVLRDVHRAAIGQRTEEHVQPLDRRHAAVARRPGRRRAIRWQPHRQYDGAVRSDHWPAEGRALILDAERDAPAPAHAACRLAAQLHQSH